MAEMREAAFGAGAGAVGVTEQDLPLAFRMVENIPGIAASAGFMAFRGSNTLVEGGRFDYKGGRRGKRLQRKFRVLDQGAKISGINSAQYLGGGRLGGGLLGARAARKVEKAKTAATAVTGRGYGVASNFNFRAARANIFTANPSAVRRLGSITSFMSPAQGMYSPFAAANLAGSRGPIRNSAIKRMGLQNVAADESVFGPGLLSFISAGTKIDRLEAKALKGNQRAINKLGRVDQNIRALATANNPAMLAKTQIYGTVRQDLTKAFRAPAGGVYIDGKFYKGGTFLPGGAAKIEGVTAASRYRVKAGQTVTFNGKTYFGSGTGTVGSKGGQFFPGAGRYVDHQMVTGFGPSMLDDGLGKMGSGLRGNLMASSMSGEGTRYIAGYFRGAMGHAGAGGLEGAALRGAEKAAVHLAGKGTTRAMALGAKGLGLAIPGLNVLATAALVYDLGKMAGEVVKSGINLAKDANKSLQGTINKPLFGMGYKDTEAAATSRSRGVMAIQNSRLNARSMLGSEAAMMAAHYG